MALREYLILEGMMMSRPLTLMVIGSVAAAIRQLSNDTRMRRVMRFSRTLDDRTRDDIGLWQHTSEFGA